MLQSTQVFPDIKLFRKLAEEYNMIPVHCRFSADLETPVTAYLKVKRGRYSFLLESVEGGENIARYSIIGTDPVEVMRISGEDPLIKLKNHLHGVKHFNTPELPKFNGGAVGYIAYEAVSQFEPSVAFASGGRHSETTGMNIPEAVFMFADSVLVFDHLRHEIIVIAHARLAIASATAEIDLETVYHAAAERVRELGSRLDSPLQAKRRIAANASTPKPDINTDYAELARQDCPPYEKAPTAYFANTSLAEYADMIKECRNNIHRGELLQVVVSQRLLRRVSSAPFDIYRALRSINPSPYMFFLDLDEFQILGASPELLVSYEDGKVSVHPIAGTMPRGATPAEDKQNGYDLLNNEKEVAEHVMLLDLGRNDVGRVCKPGTVKVEQQMDLEYYSHVIHIVSHVTGKIRPDLDCFAAMRAAFPAGTVSGAPKVRAMQLISELERNRRGVYAGAIGYFAYSGNMDCCIALRTMMVRNGIAYLQAGGGIVADSVTATEYAECLHKMGALIQAIENAEYEAANGATD